MPYIIDIGADPLPQGCYLKVQRDPHGLGTNRTFVLQIDDDAAPNAQDYVEAV